MSDYVNVEHIRVGERFRVDYGDVNDLAESINKHGLLQPLVVRRLEDGNVELVAGGRRLAAVRLLGWPRVYTTFREEVDDLTARELELEENIRRKDLDWTERCRLTAEIDRLKREKYGSNTGAHAAAPEEVGWSTTQTAVSLDVDQATVSRDLIAARIIEAVPELADCPDRKTAIKLFDEHLEAVERELARREATHDSAFANSDALTFLATLPDACVDVIIMDPPYGTDVQNLHTGRSSYTNAHFDDSAQVSNLFFTDLLHQIRRVAKPNAHIYCFSGVYDWNEPADHLSRLKNTMQELAAVGFDVDPMPLVWCKTSEGLVDWSHRFALMWEPIVFCKGRSLREKRSNVFVFDSVPQHLRNNIAEKPVALLTELIRMSTEPGETVLDPCAGSGSTLVAAKASGRLYLGCEPDRDQWHIGQQRLENEMSPDEIKAMVIDGQRSETTPS